jgi:hypothetical protein
LRKIRGHSVIFIFHNNLKFSKGRILIAFAHLKAKIEFFFIFLTKTHCAVFHFYWKKNYQQKQISHNTLKLSLVGNALPCTFVASKFDSTHNQTLSSSLWQNLLQSKSRTAPFTSLNDRWHRPFCPDNRWDTKSQLYSKMFMGI